jgi:hypothetical protein
MTKKRTLGDKGFLGSEICKNWAKYQDRYKHTLSEEDINLIKEKIGSINHEIEGAYSHNGKFGPLYILEKLYTIQKCIAISNSPILFEL